MNDHDIQQILSSLPEHRASDQFTDRVLERLAAPRRTIRYRALAAAAAIVLTLGGAGLWSKAAQQRRDQQRLQALRTEREAIRRELEELKKLTGEFQEPVIEIEGKGADLVIDLREQNSVRPAKHVLPPI